MNNITKKPNPAHALDGGIALQFHISYHWSAASDVIRWATGTLEF